MILGDIPEEIRKRFSVEHLDGISGDISLEIPKVTPKSRDEFLEKSLKKP